METKHGSDLKSVWNKDLFDVMKTKEQATEAGRGDNEKTQKLKISVENSHEGNFNTGRSMPSTARTARPTMTRGRGGPTCRTCRRRPRA